MYYNNDMNKVLNQLKPEAVWRYFEEICQVPRPSKKEEKIIAFLQEFGKKQGLETLTDAVGNVLIRKPATTGREQAPTVVLQAHSDMVCEKNAGTDHNFDTDPIRPYIDGEWVRAHGTTLGADDGIGIAACLAVLAATDIAHGPIECLFTVDEETGLSGAFALQPGFLKGKILLNLDSEDEGEIFIGCAGGIDTTVRLPRRQEPVAAGHFAATIRVKGLQGGHSGDDINKGRGNAIKILNRFLWEFHQKHPLRIAALEGGNLRNAIAREASATVVLPGGAAKEAIRAEFNIYASEMERVWKITEPGLQLELESADLPATAADNTSTTTLLGSLYACPHGVFSMSYRMPGLVETSTNLAAVRETPEGEWLITTSQRSDVDSEKMNIAHMVESLFLLAGAGVTHGDGYPGWAPNPDSPVLKVAVESYRRLFGKEPVVRSIHAGLECGLFLEKYPEMDMISFGPTLRGVHSPDEKIEIRTVEMWWNHLVDILTHV